MDDTSRRLDDAGGRRGAEGGFGNHADEEMDADTARRTRELESEIERTRGEMSETIEAIQDRLRPSTIVSNTVERVKSATTEKVKHMADTATHSARDLMDRTRDAAEEMSHRTPRHTVPTALIGIGCAWLMYDWMRDPDRRRHTSSLYDEDGVAPGMFDPEEFYRDTDTWDAPAESGRLSQSSHSARRLAQEAGTAVRRTQNQLQRLMHSNPLIVAAGALAVGAAVGLALPATQRENELMGEARESVMEHGEDLARSAASHAKDAAGSVAGDLINRIVSG
jgi:gas vesicle protein